MQRTTGASLATSTFTGKQTAVSQKVACLSEIPAFTHVIVIEVVDSPRCCYPLPDVICFSRRMGLRRRLRRTSSVSSDELCVSVQGQRDDRVRIPFAKRKKADSRLVISMQVALILFLVLFVAYAYYYFDDFHFHVTKFYAHHVGDHHALHLMGHHMLKDQANATAAFQYFRQSADSGHPESAYNLAAGHLSGYKTDVAKGELLSFFLCDTNWDRE